MGPVPVSPYWIFPKQWAKNNVFVWVKDGVFIGSIEMKILKIWIEGLCVDFILTLSLPLTWTVFPQTSWPPMFCTAPPLVRLELTAAEGIPCKILWLGSWFNTNTQVIWSKYWEVMVPAVWLCHDKENCLIYTMLPAATFTYELCLENQIWTLSTVGLFTQAAQERSLGRVCRKHGVTLFHQLEIMHYAY